jgi:hypothetical protein
MYRQKLYEAMLQKLYKKADLQTYAGTPANVGFNSLTRPSSNILNLNYVSTGTTWSGLKFTGGSFDMLEDLDDPSNPIVYGSNCNYTYGTGGGGGSGSGGGPGEPQPKKDGLAKDVKTGDDGGNGEDGDDNTTDSDWFFEDGDAPRIDKGSGNYLETTDLAVVKFNGVSGEDQTVELEFKDQPADYILIDMNGKVVAEGTIHTSIVLPHLAKGTYVLRIMQGQAMDIKKIQF